MLLCILAAAVFPVGTAYPVMGESPEKETVSSGGMDGETSAGSEAGIGDEEPEATPDPTITAAETEAAEADGSSEDGSGDLSDEGMGLSVRKHLADVLAGFAAGIVLTLILSALWRSGKKKSTVSEADFPGPEVGESDPGEAAPVFSATEKIPPEDDSAVVSPSGIPEVTIGKVHNAGRRRNQQDTFGCLQVGNFLLAVVSDGMGGLSDGEKVSQQAVRGMFEAAESVKPSVDENPLYEMLRITNEKVLAMLGPEKIYKSGATLLTAWTDGRQFQWIAVGDSRMYLFCGHHLLQLNREHIYKQQLLKRAVNGKISLSMVKTDPQRDRLASFLGMGDLEEIDGSLRPVFVQKGDRLLLMSDGVFNTISEEQILEILEAAPSAEKAAEQMERQVLEAENPKQDNFTCLILDF